MSGGNSRKAPVATLERLATYLTVLSDLAKDGVETVSSMDMERMTGINAAQFRKDLSYFGEFGRPGIGYSVAELHLRIARILRIEDVQKVILIGAGNLGSALAGYPGLRMQNFQICAVFDNNYNKIGRRLWDLEIYDVARLKEINRRIGARIGIIAVPASAAQEVAERLVEADITAILNFAPVALKLAQGIAIRNVDLVQELAVLSFHLSDDDVGVPDSTEKVKTAS